MPISIDRFEGDEDIVDPPTSVRIVQFLLENDDSAYMRREIAEAIDADPETVGTNLTRLKNDGLVRHREPYWALPEDREAAVEMLRERDETPSVDLGDDATGRNAVEGDQRRPSSTDRPVHPHREAAETFGERVRAELGDSIEILSLFGSVAQGTETHTSDVDVLAVVTDDADFGAVDDELLDIAYDVQLRYDVPVEVHSMRKAEFDERERRAEPFIRTVLEEGVDV